MKLRIRPSLPSSIRFRRFQTPGPANRFWERGFAPLRSGFALEFATAQLGLGKRWPPISFVSKPRECCACSPSGRSRPGIPYLSSVFVLVLTERACGTGTKETLVFRVGSFRPDFVTDHRDQRREKSSDLLCMSVSIEMGARGREAGARGDETFSNRELEMGASDSERSGPGEWVVSSARAT